MVQFRELNTHESGHASEESDALSCGDPSASSVSCDSPLHADDPSRCQTRVVPVRLAPDQAELDRLGDEIAELAGYVHATTYQLLVRLREFDERNGWAGGFKSCAHWLGWRTSIAPVAAREKVRVARALAQLTLLSEAMRRGELSYAKIRCATRVATPVNESELLELARHATAAQMEKVVRGWRRVNRQAELEADGARHARRHLTLYVDDDGSYVLRGRLDPEVGALLERALAAAEQALYRGRRAAARPALSREHATGTSSERRAASAPESGASDAPGGSNGGVAACALAAPLQSATGEPESRVQRRADALALVAECALRSELAAAGTEDKEAEPDHSRLGRADRFQVVVHVDAEALRESSETGQSVLGDGLAVPAESSRRLACDASRVVMQHDKNGAVLSVGRRTRVVPVAIRRALQHRDRGCRFPGCTSLICDSHHIRHWADGGETQLENLVLCCRRHHRALHEGGYRMRLTSTGEIEVLRPNGEPLPNVPPAPILGNDPVSALKRSHCELGVEIGAWTATPLWQGERLDLDYAVRSYVGLAAAQPEDAPID